MHRGGHGEKGRGRDAHVQTTGRSGVYSYGHVSLCVSSQERLKAETLNRKLRGQLADYRVPHVLQYITAKDSHSQLEQSVRTWERKVEISEVTRPSSVTPMEVEPRRCS